SCLIMGLLELTRAGCSKDIQPSEDDGANACKCSEFMNAEEIGEILRPGDLIEFKRFFQLGKLKKRFYTHWGVYVGKPEGKHIVAHMFITSEGLATAFTAVIGDMEHAEVRLDTLEEVCTDLCRINNLDDRKFKKMDSASIFKRAIDSLGQHNYNLIYDNCEHFAKWCRYDKHTSNQVTRWQPGVSHALKYFWKFVKLTSMPAKIPAKLSSVLPVL
ncbi:hypothetical protein PENTCL1PPCAC_7183, partial [Pristionchus entomophagus]